MQRLSGIAPQRGLPAPTGPVNPSRPVVMPPVPVRRVSSGYDSRERQPLAASPAQPSPHTQHTIGLPPLRPVSFSQPTQPMPPHRPGSAASPGKDSRSKNRKRNSRPMASPLLVARSRPEVRPNQARVKRDRATLPKASRQEAPFQPAQPVARPNGTAALPLVSQLALPRSISNRRMEREGSDFSVWFAQLSLGAKLRLLVVLLISIWLCGIMAPAGIIQALVTSFEDNGALPGDRRSIVNQVRQNGARGALAALPFVETTTPHRPRRRPRPTHPPRQQPSRKHLYLPGRRRRPTRHPRPRRRHLFLRRPQPAPLLGLFPERHWLPPIPLRRRLRPHPTWTSPWSVYAN